MLKRYRWPWLAMIAVTTVVLGFVGYTLDAPGKTSVLERVVLVLKLFKMDGTFSPDPPWQLAAARGLGAFFTVAALVKVWSQLFREQISDFRLSLWTGHAVVCGLGRKGMHLVAELGARGARVAVAQLTFDKDDIETCRGLGAIATQGDATKSEFLGRMGVEHAKEVFAVCGGDRTNFEIGLQTLARYREAGATHPLTCHVHLVELPLLHQLQHRDFLRDLPGGFSFRFFNVHEHCARRLMARHPLPPVRGPEDAPVHLVLAGEGSGLHAMLLQHARTAHLADLLKPRITVLAPDAGRERRALLATFPQLEDICRLEWRDLVPGRAGVLEGVELKTCQPRMVVVFENDQSGLTAALALRDAAPDPSLPIFVKVADRAGLSRLLQGANAEVGRLRLITFGAVEEVCAVEIRQQDELDHMAQALHDSYRRTQLAAGVPAKPSLEEWPRLPESYKSANRNLADHVEVKLQAIGCRRERKTGRGAADFTFTAKELELLARMEHERWSTDRRLAGWVFGPVRDETRREHSCLAPWERLPEAERQKDRDAVLSVPRALDEAGWMIVRG